MADWSISEYGALRAEILERSKTQHQIVVLSVGVAAFAVPYALETGSRDRETIRLFLLCFPLLSTMLLLMWAHSHQKIKVMATYIFERFETSDRLGDGWEHFRDRQKSVVARGTALTGPSVILLSTYLLPVCLAVWSPSLNGVGWRPVALWLAGTDTVLLLVSLWLMWLLRGSNTIEPAKKGATACVEQGATQATQGCASAPNA
jgi:hypothetical protein